MKKSMAILAALGLVAIGAGAILPQQQTTTETGVDSSGFAWSGSFTVRAAPYPDTVSFSTHACGGVSMSYASESKYNASCVLEDCEQAYLDDVLNGQGDPPGSDRAKCGTPGDPSCCADASAGLAHCLQYPTSDCLN